MERFGQAVEHLRSLRRKGRAPDPPPLLAR